MLISIGHPDNVPAFLESVKKREKVLSGFGHRCASSRRGESLTTNGCAGCTRRLIRGPLSSVRSRTKSSKSECMAGVIVSRALMALLLSRTGKDELLETAMRLHDAAMKDDYFTSRKLAPNVGALAQYNTLN
jgi:citrate synthase